MAQGQQFSNRWGIILASLGMAIGAGNLWRFPRLAGQYGGSFILLWILFLLVWSIPLLLTEFSIGKRFRSGVIGSYGKMVGKRFAWMGFFIAVCSLGIAFYYSIVTAWSVEYLGIALYNLYQEIALDRTLSDVLMTDERYLQDQWENLSNGSLTTVCAYIVIVILGIYVISKGVSQGLERANRILIPGLFVLLLVIAFSALNTENGVRGLHYMFLIDPADFRNPTVWIEALSQSAWSTGAGWGLMITISSYSRTKEDVTLNTFIGAFGNNSASLLAGVAILPAVFALAASETEALNHLQSGSQSLTFTIIPKLFATIPGGSWMTVFFFMTLTLAAFSSFLPMVDLFSSNLMQAGMKRHWILACLVAGFVIFGFPSAYSLDFFANQDWVWGLGLILSGIFVAFAGIRYGPGRFKADLIDGDSDFRLSDGLYKFCIYIIPPIGVILIYWWMSQGYSANPWLTDQGGWNWMDVYSNASIVTQWGAVILLGLILNRFLYRKFCL